MKKISYSLLFLLLIACEEVPVFDEQQTRPVVQAYLYAGKSVDSLYVTTLVPFNSGLEEAPPVTDANLVLETDGQSFPLSASTEAPGYYQYEGDDLTIEVSSTYRLSFEFEGSEVQAETTVPTPPTNLTLSAQEIFLPQFTDPRELFQNRDLLQQTISLEWSYEEDASYYMVVENLEGSPEAINLSDLDQRFTRFVTRPTQDNFLEIRPLGQFQYFGRHRIRVYKVNEEYVNLYESLEQDSRNLNEPYSNIQNGLGIFTAFSFQETYLEVKKQ
ncbi:MAG: DUF4249 family protein [Bacteroidota bacterium]